MIGDKIQIFTVKMESVQYVIVKEINVTIVVFVVEMDIHQIQVLIRKMDYKNLLHVKILMIVYLWIVVRIVHQ